MRNDHSVSCEYALDGKVELSASSYASLIKRLCTLENAASRLEIEARILLHDAIRTSRIENLNKEQILATIRDLRSQINPDVEKYFYAFHFEDIIKKTMIFNYEEIKRFALDVILEALYEHMNKLDQDSFKNDAGCEEDPSNRE